jgi:Leucine-rich repeat (LRR) protein
LYSHQHHHDHADRLRRLDASNNKLVKLPNEMTNLHRLEELTLNNNQLAELPEFIGLMWRYGYQSSMLICLFDVNAAALSDTLAVAVAVCQR